jgi:hypothetical protein
MRDVFKVSPAQSRKALDFLGAGLLIGKSPLPGLKPIGEAAPDIPWLENPSAYPPWICVREGLWAPDPETEWRMMEKKGWNFKRVAFVDEPIGVGIFGVRDLTILREGVNRVLLRAPGIGRSLLVSSETNAPGWNVFSGGKKFVPLMVHHVFRGVILEEGTTEAEWRYEPATFRLGLFASLFSTGLGFAWLLLTLGTSAGSAKPLRGEAV